MIADTTRALILADLRADEGLRLKAYDDATGEPVDAGGKCEGTLTIGYGHTGADVAPGQIISEADAENLLRNDETKAELQTLSYLPWVADIDTVRQTVLVELMFNMGWGDGVKGLSGFHNTLADMKQGLWDQAADGLLHSLADHQEPNRVARWAEKLRSA